MTGRYGWWTGDEQPHLHEWWLPLLAASRRARFEQVPWPIYIDEFAIVGRADRGPRPAVWAYRHGASGHVMLTDFDGGTYRYIPRVSDPERGQFRSIDIRAAIWRARLPDHVKPVWYEPPERRVYAEPEIDVSPRPLLRLVHEDEIGRNIG